MADTVVALLLPLAFGAAADNTALVATAGLFVRQLTAALSRPACAADAVGAVGAVAGGGCGTPTDNEAGGGTVADTAAVTEAKLFTLALLLLLLLLLFVNAD